MCSITRCYFQAGGSLPFEEYMLIKETSTPYTPPMTKRYSHSARNSFNAQSKAPHKSHEHDGDEVFVKNAQNYRTDAPGPAVYIDDYKLDDTSEYDMFKIKDESKLNGKSKSKTKACIII